MIWDEQLISKFCRELQEQQALYAALLACSRRQLEALSDEPNAVALSALMPEKQQWMERIQQLEDKLAERKKAWPAVRDTLPTSRTRTVEDTLEQMQETLKNLIRCEEAGAGLLNDSLAARRNALERVATGRLAARAYHTGTAAGARFVDNRK